MNEKMKKLLRSLSIIFSMSCSLSQAWAQPEPGASDVFDFLSAFPSENDPHPTPVALKEVVLIPESPVMMVSDEPLAPGPESQTWSFTGEYLLFKPMISQSYYAQQILSSAAEPEGTRFNNPFDFESAYRLYSSWNLCDYNFQLVWTHLPTTSHTSSVHKLIGDTAGAPAAIPFTFGESKVKLQYFAIDGLIGFLRNQCRSFGYVISAGLHYANFRFSEQMAYTGPSGSNHIQNRSNSWNIGPEVGFEINYGLPHCQNWLRSLSLLFTVKSGLLANHYTAHFQRIFTAGLDFAKAQPRWDLISMWDFRLGLNYTKQYCSICFWLEMGYEMLSYQNVIDRLFFSDDFSTASIEVYSNADFQGPYIAIGCNF